MADQRKANRIWGLAAILAVGVLASPVSLFAQNSLCAVVKLQIQQQATLEREAFDAMLTVSNNVQAPLTNLQVLITLKDANGNPATQLFFISTSSLQNVNAVDGSGVIQSSSSAVIHWLIIPSSGTGGTLPAGLQYGVTASISAQSNGAPQSVNTFPAFITVHPQPVLSLQYVLPFEVLGDQPLTPQVEPVIPFPLGVRVTNIGFGTANNFQINSAQPQIVDNKLGLLVDFKLLDSVVNGTPVSPPTLLINFGNLAPQGVGQASWDMTSSLAGFFINFTSTFTHAADLGGQLTSLIQSVTTYTLVKDVLDDQPGHDTNPDFLVNRTFPRGQMQALLDSGSEPAPDVMLESDQPNPVPVVNVGGTLSGQLSGVNTSLTLTLSSGVGTGLWAHFSSPIGNAGGLTVASVTRGDGKILNPHNFWISQHFNIHTLLFNYHVHLFDFTVANQQYVLNFSTGGLSIPPSAVTNLSAQATSNGQLALNWTAPSESGGNILGGQYLIETSTNPNTVFVSTAAQIVFSTNIVAGSSQSFTLGNLTGNTTYFAGLFTEDSAGNISALSNVATGYVLPNPPQSLSFFAVNATSATVHQSKGLQWPAVFLPAMRQNRFPSRVMGGVTLRHVIPDNAIEDPLRYRGTLEDETRLLYVAVTRAQKYLYTTFAPVAANKQQRNRSDFFNHIAKQQWVSTTESAIGGKRLKPRPVQETPQVTLSFSEMKYLFECPYQFKLRFLYGFNAPIHEELGYGKGLHDALAEIHKRALEKDIVTKDSAAALIDRHLNPRFANPALRKQLRNAGIKVLERYFDTHGKEIANTEFSEKQIQVHVAPGITVDGRIDLIRRLDTGEVAIVDFKSTERAQAEDVTRDQLHVYAVGYQELTGKTADLIEVLNLDEKGKTVREPVNDPLLALVREKIKKSGEALRTNNLPRLKEWDEHVCGSCDLVGLCRERPAS